MSLSRRYEFEGDDLLNLLNECETRTWVRKPWTHEEIEAWLEERQRASMERWLREHPRIEQVYLDEVHDLGRALVKAKIERAIAESREALELLAK